MPPHGGVLMSETGVSASLMPQFRQRALNLRALRHYPVDHSILGASAIAVETPEGWVGYTGDIRFHGAQPGLMEEFVQGFLGVEAFGAHRGRGAHGDGRHAPVAESDVYERIKAAISGQDGLIVADFDAMDMERLLTFNAIAEMTRRQLVLSLADAHMINAMGIVWRQFPALDEVDTIRILDVPATDSGGMQWQLDVRSRYASILVAGGTSSQGRRLHPADIAIGVGGTGGCCSCKRRVHPLTGGDGRTRMAC